MKLKLNVVSCPPKSTVKTVPSGAPYWIVGVTERKYAWNDTIG